MNDFKTELLEYLTEDGENPFHKWIISLKDRSARARIRVRLNHVRLGNFGDCKPVGKGVNELRVDYGPGYRVYYGKSETTVVILLCGGSKKSQSKDIRLAQAYWADFQRRGK
ncbi:MAG: type II toxin-antitoxin system RelE/ParE family toxin [Desulfosalsimonadaceae bacterium]